MTATAHKTDGSWRRRDPRTGFGALLACVALALSTTACGEGPVQPSSQPSEAELASAFTLQLDINTPPVGGDCIVTLTAAARGGGRGTYAEWGALEAEYLNPDTSQWEELRPQNLPEVFLWDRILTGETQTAKLDLECYRREPGEPVLVRLRFHWVVNEGGEEVRRSDTLTAECQ